ncbi:DNA cytosine methyltransferase [Thiorhodospira sibirica]|uniref:DNA cytosine methyltransferase n=1 Tax=Thiorhodospira sibirica TaxID=154347 RepID=UPI00022C175F|nr:DNA cytosine methyltransferase [Thiorhodospira sibirica]
MTHTQPFGLLKQARNRFTQREIATQVGKDIKTVRSWEKGETPCPAMLEPALRDLLQQPAANTTEGGNSFRFIDLFAGIGGIRMGFEAHGGKCVFTSEWNDFSKKTHLENYSDNPLFIGDIVPYPAEDVISVSDTQKSINLFGDTVIVLLINLVAEKMVTHLVELWNLNNKRVIYA